MVPLRLAPLLLVSLLAASLAPPAAQAQGAVCGVVAITCATRVELHVAPHEAPIAPEAGYTLVPIAVRYAYLDVLPLTTSSTEVELHITDAPSWMVASVNPSVVHMPVSQLSPSGNERVSMAQSFLVLSATTDAPAFQQGLVEVTAHARPNGALMGSTGRNSVPVVAGFFALTNARVSSPDVALGAGPARVPMSIDNLGNGPVRLSFEVAQAPPGAHVTPPATLVLESAQQHGKNTHGVAVWRIEAGPGFRAGDAVIVVRSAYALDEELQGDTVRVTLHLSRGEGGDVSVLGATTPLGPVSPVLVGLLAAATGLAAWVERRRRRA